MALNILLVQVLNFYEIFNWMLLELFSNVNDRPANMYPYFQQTLLSHLNAILNILSRFYLIHLIFLLLEGCLFSQQQSFVFFLSGFKMSGSICCKTFLLSLSKKHICSSYLKKQTFHDYIQFPNLLSVQTSVIYKFIIGNACFRDNQTIYKKIAYGIIMMCLYVLTLYIVIIIYHWNVDILKGEHFYFISYLE